MSTRVKQALILVVGLVLAGVMTYLGLWQARVFEDQGNRDAQQRAQQPPVPLLENIDPSGRLTGDIYGKQVTVRGVYLAEEQVVVVAEDGSRRLLSGLRLADGRVLPVVRGSLPAGSLGRLPHPPADEQPQRGIFLPSEAGTEHTVPGDQLGSVRLPLLAQRWRQHLLPGFITLDETTARTQGLEPAPVRLPSGDGSARNGGYALQWWVFAAFALGFAIKVSHGLGRRADEVLEERARSGAPTPGSLPDVEAD